MRLVISAGGTGGHIYPALAIARGILERHQDAEILYIGTESGMESNIIPGEGLKFQAIPVLGLKRSFSPRNIVALWKASQGFWKASSILKLFKPNVVVGTGGYVSGPVILAAILRRLPTLIHEQNSIPGITNRFLGRYVSQIALTFEESLNFFPPRQKAKITGLPLRPEILKTNRSLARQKLGIKPDHMVILSFGGSRGAHSINLAMIEVINAFKLHPKVQIIHATGEAGYQEFLTAISSSGLNIANFGNITIMKYLHNMADFLPAADLVICRAGAATIAEITALGLPTILIPYPYAAANHQEHNARFLTARGAALLVRDQELTGSKLTCLISELLSDSSRLKRMAAASKALGKPNALNDIIDCIDELARVR